MSGIVSPTLPIRVAVIALSMVVGGWSLLAMQRPELSVRDADLVWQSIGGESFSDAELDRLRTPCGQYDRNSHPRMALIAAATAMRDVERSLTAGAPDEVTRLTACAAEAARRLIETDPSTSFGWLLLAWTATISGSEPKRAEAYLEQSVAMAPRELWMAMKRLPLMEREVLRDRFDFVRNDYRTLAEGERSGMAARLLRLCLARRPGCDQDWNADLPARIVGSVRRELERSSAD